MGELPDMLVNPVVVRYPRSGVILDSDLECISEGIELGRQSAEKPG